ncbi:Neural-cadherin [Gryllus bimaculatus]|nr:Neural-cadherin [Gryllus bimaculatus]
MVLEDGLVMRISSEQSAAGVNRRCTGVLEETPTNGHPTHAALRVGPDDTAAISDRTCRGRRGGRSGPRASACRTARLRAGRAARRRHARALHITAGHTTAPSQLVDDGRAANDTGAPHAQAWRTERQSPVFSKKVYRLSLAGGEFREPIQRVEVGGGGAIAGIGGVTARDADGDKVAYRLAAPSNLVVIVPQTGDLLLAGDPPLEAGEDMEYEIAVDAHDLRHPSRTAKAPAQVYLRFSLPAEEDGEGDEEAGNEVDAAEAHGRREKRRVTRAVRPTKRIEFTEADGENEGRVVFQLEKETERETFKIREENPWVTVEPNGAVRVKKKWDYEELGPEKTIDFWVTITNAGGGERLPRVLRTQTKLVYYSEVLVNRFMPEISAAFRELGVFHGFARGVSVAAVSVAWEEKDATRS